MPPHRTRPRPHRSCRLERQRRRSWEKPLCRSCEAIGYQLMQESHRALGRLSRCVSRGRVWTASRLKKQSHQAHAEFLMLAASTTPNGPDGIRNRVTPDKSRVGESPPRFLHPSYCFSAPGARISGHPGGLGVVFLFAISTSIVWLSPSP
jgi:hypothetical protein